MKKSQKFLLYLGLVICLAIFVGWFITQYLERGKEFIHAVLFIVIVVLAYNTYRHYIFIRVYENVSYSILKNAPELICQINEPLRSNKLLCSFEITEEDRKIFSDIFKEYKKYISKLFFENRILTRYFANMDSQEYLFATFFDFLKEHSTDYSFNGNDIREYDCKIDEYTDQYNLTDFGVVYYKVYLGIGICPLPFWPENVIICKNSEHIQEVIKTRKIQIMHYRP